MVIKNAIEFASLIHKGEFRKGKDGKDLTKPYFNHPKNVYKILNDLNVNDTLKIAGLLHDTIESVTGKVEKKGIDFVCKIFFEIIKENFGDDVAKLVVELTSNKMEIKKSKKSEYLLNKMLNMSDDALTIKLADRLDNARESFSCSSDFIKHYREETLYILKKLKKRSLKDIHKKLINKISCIYAHV